MIPVRVIAGRNVAELPAEGPLLASEQDAVDLVGQLYGVDVDVVAIPVGRLRDGFFQLRTGQLGGFVQKLTNYRLGVAFVGDVRPHVEASEAFRAYVVESNRRRVVLFAPSIDALAELLPG